jgi:membrane protease YdiL (CAAX protease family)
LEIFALGVLFTWLRARSGSTSLTVILHSVVNCAALAQAAVFDYLS